MFHYRGKKIFNWYENFIDIKNPHWTKDDKALLIGKNCYELAMNCYAKKISSRDKASGAICYLGSYAQMSHAMVESESNKVYQFP